MFVYILYSASYDKYYIGHTSDMDRRINEHNGDDAGWTKSYQPWEIAHKERCSDRLTAIEKEKYLKSLKNKERLQDYIAGWRNGTSGGS